MTDDGSGVPTRDPPSRLRPSRAAASQAGFVVALVVAAVVILRTNRDQWFFLDEWDFLAGRELGDPGDLLRPHNEHWTTLPIVVYRLLFRAVGMRHYWPYQIPVLAAHLTAVSLLRTVMLRARVDPLIATVSSIVLLFLGSGRSDLAWGFQITFTGALALGLAHLLLADHEGPADRRDLLGLVSGLAALMCSGVGVAMVVAVGVSTLIGRGWRRAMLHVVPLATAYLLWLVAYGQAPTSRRPTVAQLTQFGWDLVREPYLGLGQHALVALMLGALSVLGLLSIRSRPTSPGGSVRLGLRPGGSMVVGLVAGAVALIALTGWARASISSGQGVPDRYIHIVVALVLPALAIGATVTVQRWPRVTVPVLLVLGVGLPGNVGELTPAGADRFALGSPVQMVALANAAAAEVPPPTLRPDPLLMPDVTVGWLIATREAGRFPDVGEADGVAQANARLAVALEQLPGQARISCSPARLPDRLLAGDILEVRAATVVVVEPEAGGSATYYAADSLQEVLMARSTEEVIRLRVARVLQVSIEASGPGPLATAVCR